MESATYRPGAASRAPLMSGCPWSPVFDQLQTPLPNYYGQWLNLAPTAGKPLPWTQPCRRVSWPQTNPVHEPDSTGTVVIPRQQQLPARLSTLGKKIGQLSFNENVLHQLPIELIDLNSLFNYQIMFAAFKVDISVPMGLSVCTLGRSIYFSVEWTNHV